MPIVEWRPPSGGGARSACVAPLVVAIALLAGCSAETETNEELAVPAATGTAADVGSTPAPTPSIDAAPFGVDGSSGGGRTSVASCPEGSNPDQPGPADQERPGEDGGPMAFDRGSGRIVLLESGWDLVSQHGSRTWSFDVCTNTWMRMDPPFEPPVGVRGLVYDEDSDLVVALGGIASGWAYDVDGDTWREGQSPVSIEAAQAAHDPVTGLVLVRDGSRGSMYSFDADTGAWEDVRQGAVRPPTTDGPMHGQVMAYDPTIDRIVLFVEGHGCCPTTWLFDPRSNRWTETDAETPTIDFVFGDLTSGGEIAYDEAVRRTVIASGSGRHSFDASVPRWESEPLGLHRSFGVRLVYDAVNERLVLLPGNTWMDGRWTNRQDVLAWDAAADGWIELVPPLEG